MGFHSSGCYRIDEQEVTEGTPRESSAQYVSGPRFGPGHPPSRKKSAALPLALIYL